MSAGRLPADAPLALTSTAQYIVLTFILHAVYGALNGWLIPAWTGARRSRAQSA